MILKFSLTGLVLLAAAAGFGDDGSTAVHTHSEINCVGLAANGNSTVSFARHDDGFLYLAYQLGAGNSPDGPFRVFEVGPGKYRDLNGSRELQLDVSAGGLITGRLVGYWSSHFNDPRAIMILAEDLVCNKTGFWSAN